ncbi:uncharacterized protein LOC112588403 [Harpegnathos saltator]|uniref:uncharacterized protein LOC112588403 n=1 Tax=Harpegnathos saltator TaxID=610380 RepID=UPI000DBEE09C|nr:uncharacterized protein LOC112588403 [Harpegnathos saltator]
MYKKLCKRNKPLNNMWNFSYTFNTDGCQAANSSKVSIWPIYATLNELPYKMRSKYMMLLGIWVNKRESNMQIFLQPFVKEANFLSTYGLQWQYDKNTIITSRIISICCCVDSVARPAMLNMKQFNGHYGCTFCEHPTEYVEGYRKYPVSTNIFPNRTNVSIKQNMITAHATSIPIKGVKGPSPLMSLKYFDLVNGMVPDYMHSVLLGVTKQLTEMYFSYPGKKFYVGQPNMFETINNRLLHIRPPKNITRQPRSLHERSLWKASEWRSWLMWYSLVCLYGILPKKYVAHLAQLVCAIHTFFTKIHFNRHDTKSKFTAKKICYFISTVFWETCNDVQCPSLTTSFKQCRKLGTVMGNKYISV